MSFKENLFRKIEIDRLSEKVVNSIPVPYKDTGKNVDKDAMRKLLEYNNYAYRRVRDLDCYTKKDVKAGHLVFVLDNELPIYNTTPEDVAMRRSPTLKEMVKIRNAIKILRDSDVKISIKQDSAMKVAGDCISDLDLSYNDSDIYGMEHDGITALEKGLQEKVLETLSLFFEMLGYRSAPKGFRVIDNSISGMTGKKKNETLFGPAVVYNEIYNSIKLIKDTIGSFDKGRIEFYQSVVAGKKEPSKEGADVFSFLKDEVLRKKPVI